MRVRTLRKETIALLNIPMVFTLAYGNYVSARLKLAGAYYPAPVVPCFCCRSPSQAVLRIILFVVRMLNGTTCVAAA